MILGKGINDLDYKVTKRVEKLVKGEVKVVNVIICEYYYLWKCIFQRCYGKISERSQRNYQGVTICEDWLKCSNFKSWMEKQSWQGMQLDKDILVPGNKIYSPDTCCFVPSQVNSFLCMSNNSRGLYPIGVSKGPISTSGTETYISRGAKGFSYLGLFSSPNEAHKTWQINKLKVFDDIIDLCKSYKNIDPRLVPAIIKLREGLEEDIQHDCETTHYHWKGDSNGQNPT